MKPIYRGDNNTYTLSFKDNKGEPIPITGWKIYFTMKRELSHSDDEADIKINVIDHDDGENGITSIRLSNGQTDKLIPDMYFYDIQVKKLDNTILTLIVGEIEVKADVTRRED
jgi:hypothetical protein